MASYDAIAVDLLLVEPEVGGAMGDKAVVFDKGALVEENVEPFAGGEFSLVVLGFDAGWSAAEFGFSAAAFEEVELFSHGHGR